MPKGTEPPRSPVFITTHWSIVLSASSRNDAAGAHAALESLCKAYWSPLYGYVRRRGYSPEDAKDLTQEFFARLLDRNGVAGVTPEKGRFRSFLLASMNHFLADEWDKARAQKRGGPCVVFLDLETAEAQFGEFPAAGLSPERAFEHRWAIALLQQVYRRLEDEHSQKGRRELFEVLRGALAGASGDAPYAELAGRLKISEGAVKVAVHRLRQRYRELLREAISDTVSSPAEVEDELRYLYRALAG